MTTPTELTTERNRKLWLLLLGLTVASAFLHLYLLFRLNINWDEFRFLSNIYAVQGGQTAFGLNDLHVFLYGWLTLIPFQEADQIITARVIQLALFLTAMALLFRLFREFLEDEVALACVFLSMCFSFVLIHATSFRFDTLSLFFSTVALYCLWTGRSWKTAMIGGLTLALSIMVSIKTALWAPTILGVAVASIIVSDDRPTQVRQVMIYFATSVIFFGVIYGALYLLWGAGQADPSAAGVNALANLQRVATDMFAQDEFLPRRDYFIRSISENPGHWLLILIGTIVALRQALISPGFRLRAVFALLLALPLASVFIYRNAFPYYYVYVLPPAMLAAGIGLTVLANRIGGDNKELRHLVIAIPVLFGVTTSALFFNFHAEGIQKQKRILEAVHLMFPEPVYYVGPHGMISSYPRIGPFMSTWGLLNYHRRGELQFVDDVRQHEPKFMLLHHVAFANVEVLGVEDQRMFTLLPEDKAILDENFVHHWGPIFIAGKRFEIEEPDTPVSFEIIISGPHRIEADSTVDIDGTLHEPGTIVFLDKGTYTLTAPESEYVVLRWGGDLPYPDFPPPLGATFDPF